MDNSKVVEKAAALLVRDPPFMVLTGAGISVESGLPPFRGPGGIWTRYDPEEYGHITTFENEPEKAWILLEEMIDGSVSCKPNGAHRAIARLEAKGLCGPIVTQNVDGLHRAAGSRDILDVHGDARKIYCPGCGSRSTIDEKGKIVKKCECGSYLRPDIVFYGEGLPEKKIGRAFETALKGRDLLVIGTSGVVMPVAQIPFLVHSAGGRIVEINTEPSSITGMITNEFIRSAAVAGTEALEGAILDRI